MVNPARCLPGPEGGTTKKVFTLWALLLFLAATQSQSVSYNEHYKSLTSGGGVSESSHRAHPGRSPAEIPLLKRDTTTQRFRSTEEDENEADRFPALAPAQLNGVVRAPLAQPGESIGLKPLSQARLLQDLEVEDIVLLATIDGTIHARDRKTGQERWSLGVPDSPMIETIHHSQNQSSQVEGNPELDYIFIVEPSKDGSLYIQHKNPEIGLQRLGITVRSLAATTPHFIHDPPLVTTAEQHGDLFMIDAASGTVLKQFKKQQNYVNDDLNPSCRKMSGFELDESACKPFGTLYLGRMQYVITISSAVTGENLCTIKFSEWTPNTSDSDLQGQYVEPLDSCHIQSYHNGRIIGLDNSKQSTKPRFTHVLDTPVARVFDVMRPLDNKDGSAPLVILSQPEPSDIPTSHLWADPADRSRVFVNRTEAGDWYAMSEESYPGVTSHASLARLFLPGSDERALPLDFETDGNEIVGVHVLSNAPIPNHMPVRLTIGPSPASDVVLTPEHEVAPKLPPQPPAFFSGRPIAFDILGWIMVLGTVLFAIGLKKNHKLALQIKAHLWRAGLPITTDLGHQPADVTISTDTKEVQELPVGIYEAPVSEKEAGALTTSTISRTSTLEPPIVLLDGTKSQAHDLSSEGESDDEDTKPNDDGSKSPDSSLTGPRKRRAKRGKRGGKNSKKKKQMSPEALDEDTTVVVSEVPTKDGLLQVGRLKIDTSPSKCLGHGSNGTTVFPGDLDGREVAVKRLIRSSNSLAAKEIKHLLSSDENPHVIRYFGKEESQHFTYIALDLFTSSLDQVIEHPERFPGLVSMPIGFDIKDALRQITDGVQHLHSLKLVHRDIKPQNVLVRAVKSSRPLVGLPKLQFVISDFGLCKPLEEGPESTFAPTANHTAAGTTGWRAPELLVSPKCNIPAQPSNSSGSTPASATHSTDGASAGHTSRRATKAIDIFSLGCVFYYVMTLGQHPYDVGGTSLGRDLNIKNDHFTTEGLQIQDHWFDSADLIMQMLKHDPKDRPDTASVLRHPYFWSIDEKLEFLCDMSNRYEHEKTFVSPTSDEMLALELVAPNVISKGDFLKALPNNFINEMGKQRKYTGHKMLDLLRVIRNKWEHFHDLPENVKEMMMGGAASREEGYYGFWAKRFPSLLINCHVVVVERGLVEKWNLKKYF